MQAKLARDDAHAEMENDRVVVARERERHASRLLLERVRTQMMDVYRPLTAAIMAASQARRYMARELDFEWLTLTGLDACFMRPSERLYPHLEVYTHDYTPFWAHARESQGGGGVAQTQPRRPPGAHSRVHQAIERLYPCTPSSSP
jgi:hypothetical protein